MKNKEYGKIFAGSYPNNPDSQLLKYNNKISLVNSDKQIFKVQFKKTDIEKKHKGYNMILESDLVSMSNVENIVYKLKLERDIDKNVVKCFEFNMEFDFITLDNKDLITTKTCIISPSNIFVNKTNYQLLIIEANAPKEVENYRPSLP